MCRYTHHKDSHDGVEDENMLCFDHGTHGKTHPEAIKPTFSQIGHEFDGPREFIAKKKGVSN